MIYGKNGRFFFAWFVLNSGIILSNDPLKVETICNVTFSTIYGCLLSAYNVASNPPPN